MIGLPLFNSSQSSNVSLELLVPARAQDQPAKRDQRLWGRECPWPCFVRIVGPRAGEEEPVGEVMPPPRQD